MSTLTLRAMSGLNPKSLATFSQTRSKLRPTSSPRPLTTGLPELPPVVAVGEKPHGHVVQTRVGPAAFPGGARRDADALRQIERLLPGVLLDGAGEPGLRLVDHRIARRVSLHVREAHAERPVGVGRNGAARLRDDRATPCGPEHRGAAGPLRLPRAQGAKVLVEGQPEVDERIPARGERGFRLAEHPLALGG